MKNLKAKIAAVTALLLLFAVTAGFSGCGREEKEETSESETVTEHKMELDELTEIIIPASVKNDMATVFEYSFMDMDKAFEDMIDKKQMDKATVYSQLTEQLGTEITCYTDYLKKQSEIQNDALKIQYGDDFKVTYEIIEQNTCTEEERKEKIALILAQLEGSGLASSRYFDPSKAEEFCEIDFDYTIEGSKYKQSSAKIITVMKYDGEWVYGDVEFI